MSTEKIVTIEDIDTFIFHKEWFDDIKDLEKDVQAKVIFDICRKGANLEPLFGDDVTVRSLVNVLSRNVNGSKNAYVNKINMGKAGGAKKRFNPKDIYDLARSGKSVAEIAYELGCSESTVRHSQGYIHRKDETYTF